MVRCTVNCKGFSGTACGSRYYPSISLGKLRQTTKICTAVFVALIGTKHPLAQNLLLCLHTIFHFLYCRNCKMKEDFVENDFTLTNCSNPNTLW